MKPSTTTLSKVPHLKNQVLLLIEEAFGYQKPHEYEVDFLPLMKKENWDNIILHLNEENELMACGGFRKLSLAYKDKRFKMAFIGAIATAQKYRGLGLGTLTMNTLLGLLKEEDLIMLWSDKIEFYRKFGFENAGSLSENIGADWCAHNKTVALNELSQEEQRQIISYYELFQASHNAYPIRSEQDWETIFQMKSVRCTLHSDFYILANKGMDLSPLIHEVGCAPDSVAKLKSKLSLYSYWLKHPQFQTPRERFSGMCKSQTTEITPEIIDNLFIPGIDSI